MNTSLFLLINSWAGHVSLLDALMIFCAQYVWYLMTFGVLVMAAHRYPKWRDMAIVSIGSAAVARLVVGEIIKRLYYHPRPYWVLDNVRLLLAKELESSFPSGHTIFVFALATGVYLYNKKIGKWYFALAGLVGFARVFVGVHWPYDIIGGIVLGIPTALACDWAYRKYKHRLGL